MAKVALTDVLFLTVALRGVMVFNQRVEGISSRTDLFRRVREIMKGNRGIVKVTLRNGTQGWSHTDSLLLAAS